jgi:hypothetical protein
VGRSLVLFLCLAGSDPFSLRSFRSGRRGRPIKKLVSVEREAKARQARKESVLPMLSTAQGQTKLD